MKRAPIVYFSHEFGGDQRNMDDLTPKIQELVKNYNIVPISPIHNNGFLYDTVDYDAGLEICRRLLVFSNCIVVFGNKSNSKGCTFEKKYCEDNNMPVIEYEDFGDWYNKYVEDDDNAFFKLLD